MDRRSFLAWMGLGWLTASPLFFGSLVTEFQQQLVFADNSNGIKSTIFYVAPDGNDAWTGKQANRNKTQTDGPFATLERARNAIREIKLQQGGILKQPVTVFIRGGTYFLAQPLVFTSEDSGTHKCPIIYTAYQNEKPIISGGQRLQGWQEVVINGKKLWMLEIPQVSQGQWFFRQLWVGNQRRTRARYPNKDYLQVAEVPDANINTPWTQGQSRFKYHQGDLKNWSTISNAEIVVMTRWVESRLPVVSLDEKQRIVSFAKPSIQRMEPDNSQSSTGTIYYLENALDVLDTPGEWYLDKQSGKLYYMPLAGESMNKVEAIVPRLSRLVDLQGNPDNNKFIEYLSFQNLKFAHSEWYYANNSPIVGFGQAAEGVPGSIYGQGVRYCTWQNCQITNVSNYGIEFANGCANNSLIRCQISDLGAGGVKVTQGASSIQVINCHIHNGGKIFHSAVGILVMNAPNNLISSNHIYDFYYTGISVGWTWGYQASPTKNNILEFNHIHHIGRLSNGDGPLLNDKGGIYTLGVQPGTVIRGNIIHDIDAYKYGAWGIYLDEGSSQIQVEKNLVYRTRDAGFHLHYGKNNSIHNNIFALGRFSQIRRSRPEPHLSFTFEHNIIYWNQGQLLDSDSKWDDSNYVLDRNLYWYTGKGNVRFGKLSWQEWQKTGMDKNSLIANPLFVAPNHDDFRLKPNSPAFKLGFKQTDYKKG
ncbi:MAG: right-handed parallel beta-helix repeat-containing protein [Aulosira sp. DedQUE10]|nr:right-handed parallel beta-helix repeat-containing protein [Aulosira sp. DedQUE10]